MKVRRLRRCVEAWPDCEEGAYNPSCCRFPKSCNCTVYRDEDVTDADLEPIFALVEDRGERPRKILPPDADPDVATLRAYVMGCGPPGSAHIYFGGSPPKPPSTNDALAALDRLAARIQS